MTGVKTLVMAACCASLLACGDSNTWAGEVPAADAAQFEHQVYPILMRDCAFNDCHGGPHRFFQIFGPGRVRIDPMTESDAPPTALELQVSYERARSMLISQDSVERSLLLTKPLAVKAGGVGHEGVDRFGRNVYQSKQDPSYQVLLLWATGAAVPGGSAGMGTGGTGTGTGMTGAGTGGASMGAMP